MPRFHHEKQDPKALTSMHLFKQFIEISYLLLTMVSSTVWRHNASPFFSILYTVTNQKKGCVETTSMQMEQYRSRRDKKSYVESLFIHMTGISIPHDKPQSPPKTGEKGYPWGISPRRRTVEMPKKYQRRRRRVVHF